MSGDGQPSSSQSVKRVRQIISIRLDGLSHIPLEKRIIIYNNLLVKLGFFCAIENTSIHERTQTSACIHTLI